MSKVKEQLLKKAEKEQAEYYNEVQQLTKEKIIDKAYEISIRQEIFSILEAEVIYDSNFLSDDQAQVLLSSRSPIFEIYEEWLGNDYNICEDMRQTVIDCIDVMQGEFVPYSFPQNRSR